MSDTPWTIPFCEKCRSNHMESAECLPLACSLRDRGFPIQGGEHYGTQALGMIPRTACGKTQSPAAGEALAALDEIESALYGHVRNEGDSSYWSRVTSPQFNCVRAALERVKP